MHLKKQFITGSLWVVIGRGSSNAMSFVVFAVLARLLGPADFGLVAFAAIFTDLARSLALSGIPQALIRDEKWDQEVASTAFWLNVLFSVLLALLVSASLGPLLSQFYGAQIISIVAALSLTFVIESLSSVHEAKLQRQFGYRALANRSVIGTVAGGIIGVTMAFGGYGVWALVGSRIANSLVQAVVLWTTVKWAPSFSFSREQAGRLISYGIDLGGSAILGKLNSKVAELVLGVTANAVAVGLYRVGSRAVFMLNDLVVAPLQATTLSALSRAHEKGALASAYLRIVKTCGLLAFPVYFGAAVIAQDFTILLFGEAWAHSGEVMSMLAIGGAASALLSFTQPAMVVAGHKRFVVLNNLFNLGANIVIALVAVRWGATAVALGFSARAYFSVPFALMFLKRAIHIRILTVLRSLLPSFFSAVMMAVILYFLEQTLLAGHHPLLRMIETIALGAVIYALILCATGWRLIIETKQELLPLLLGGLRKKTAANPPKSAAPGA